MPGSPQATSIVYWTVEDGRDENRRPDPEDIVGRHYRSRQAAEEAIAEFLRWDAPHRLATNRLRLEWFDAKKAQRASGHSSPGWPAEVICETRLSPDLPFEFYLGITGGEDGLVYLRRPADIRWLKRTKRTHRVTIDGAEFSRDVTDQEVLSDWAPFIVTEEDGWGRQNAPKRLQWVYPLWISRDELKLEP